MADQTNDGGPAFPSTEHHPSYDIPMHFHGMALRDYFAGQALTSVIRAFDEGRYPPDGTGGSRNGIAAGAYSIADAMLAHRAKAEGK
jgi:hypothetical protein